jgi:hypothetical protein
MDNSQLLTLTFSNVQPGQRTRVRLQPNGVPISYSIDDRGAEVTADHGSLVLALARIDPQEILVVTQSGGDASGSVVVNIGLAALSGIQSFQLTLSSDPQPDPTFGVKARLEFQESPQWLDPNGHPTTMTWQGAVHDTRIRHRPGWRAPT